jgi:hypothetical protein
MKNLSIKYTNVYKVYKCPTYYIISPKKRLAGAKLNKLSHNKSLKPLFLKDLLILMI